MTAAETPADMIRRTAGEMRARALKTVDEVTTNPYFGLASDPPGDPFWRRVGDPDLDPDVAYAQQTNGGLGGPPLAALFTPSAVAAIAVLLENAWSAVAHWEHHPLVDDALVVCREWEKATRALSGEAERG